MFRIDPQHLAWVLENLVDGHVVNQISVAKDVANNARVALQRMFEI
jgi:quinolinate synthase